MCSYSYTNWHLARLSRGKSWRREMRAIRWRRCVSWDAGCGMRDVGHRSPQERGVLVESIACILPSQQQQQQQQQQRRRSDRTGPETRRGGLERAPEAVAWRAPFLGPLSAALSRSLMLGRIGVSSYPRTGFAAIPLVAFCFCFFFSGGRQ